MSQTWKGNEPYALGTGSWLQLPSTGLLIESIGGVELGSIACISHPSGPTLKPTNKLAKLGLKTSRDGFWNVSHWRLKRDEPSPTPLLPSPSSEVSRESDP